MFGLITRRRYEEELAAAKSEIQRQRRAAKAAEARAVTAEFNRGQLLRQLGEADAANQRLTGRNRALGQRLDQHTESAPADVAHLKSRVDRLRRIVSRLLEERRQEQRRADRLQRRLDDAVGLTPRQIVDSSVWQPGYQKPTPKGAAS
jgi:chromosome segregation ATPase